MFVTQIYANRLSRSPGETVILKKGEIYFLQI